MLQTDGRRKSFSSGTIAYIPNLTEGIKQVNPEMEERLSTQVGYFWSLILTVFMPHANNKATDQPVHPPSLISAFDVDCLHSIIYILY